VPLRQGVGSEILISLALVMATGTALLAAVLLEIDTSRIELLHGLLGRGFVASSQGGIVDYVGSDAGHWWAIDGRGGVRGLNVASRDLDPGTRTLAREALEAGRPLVESGAPWQPIRFAAPATDGVGVVAGRIDAPVPAGVLAVVLVADVAIFVAFGWTLMRRRIGGPLLRLVAAVREIGEGESGAVVPVEGVAEIQALGRAFNEMQVALEARTGALEKAIHELRGANAKLLQAREGLDRSERLALVGSLAAGVAHEVGNPMGAMLAFLDVAGRDPGLGDESRRCLSRASEQGERVRVILRQLLDFSRPPRIERGPLDLADVARRVIELVAAQHSSDGIELELDVSDGVVRARGDLGLALQILLNLVLNAVAAVREREDRRVRISVEPALRQRRAGESMHGDAAAATALPRVDAILCRVEDSGPGVAAEHVDRIFAPFFTTKPPGEGTGLGLANARRLAEEMGGTVELEAERSSLGGACFRFLLPVCDPPRESVAVRSVADQSRMS
jgi:signal transduction histidine kinase